jgi:hypothetical protein
LSLKTNLTFSIFLLFHKKSIPEIDHITNIKREINPPRIKVKPKSIDDIVPKNKKQTPTMIATICKSSVCHNPLVAPFLMELERKSFLIVCFFIRSIINMKLATDTIIMPIIPRKILNDKIFVNNVKIKITSEQVAIKLRKYKTPGTLYKTETMIPIKSKIIQILIIVPNIGLEITHPLASSLSSLLTTLFLLIYSKNDIPVVEFP